MLRNSIPSGKKLASNNEFNVFVSGNVDGCEKLNIYWNDSFWSIF